MDRAGVQVKARRTIGGAAIGLLAALVFFSLPNRSAHADFVVELSRVAGLMPAEGMELRDAEPLPVRVNGVPMVYQVGVAEGEPVQALSALLAHWQNEFPDRTAMTFREQQGGWEVLSAVVLPEGSELDLWQPNGAIRGTVRVAIAMDEPGERRSRILSLEAEPGARIDRLAPGEVDRANDAEFLPQSADARLMWVLAHEDSGVPVRLGMYQSETSRQPGLRASLQAAGWEQVPLGASGRSSDRLSYWSREGRDCFLGEIETETGGLGVVVMRLPGFPRMAG